MSSEYKFEQSSFVCLHIFYDKHETKIGNMQSAGIKHCLCAVASFTLLLRRILLYMFDIFHFVVYFKRDISHPNVINTIFKGFFFFFVKNLKVAWSIIHFENMLH
jgi:hypothetical protein